MVERVIVLDASPIGLITNPKISAQGIACNQWLQSHLKAGSRVILPEIADYAEHRPKVDFGNGLPGSTYDKLLAQTRSALQAYNTKLSETDQTYNDFKALEKTLADMSDRILTGIATHEDKNSNGKNSNKYEKAGGTRKSERKHDTVFNKTTEELYGPLNIKQ